MCGIYCVENMHECFIFLYIAYKKGVFSLLFASFLLTFSFSIFTADKIAYSHISHTRARSLTIDCVSFASLFLVSLFSAFKHTLSAIWLDRWWIYGFWILFRFISFSLAENVSKFSFQLTTDRPNCRNKHNFVWNVTYLIQMKNKINFTNWFPIFFFYFFSRVYERMLVCLF